MPAAEPAKRVLLIDHVPALADVLCRTFKQHSFTVASSTAFGGEALSLLSGHPFDLILLHGADSGELAERDAGILQGKMATPNAATPLFALLTDDAGPAADLARRLGATRVFRLTDVSPRQLLAAAQQELASAPGRRVAP